MGESTKNTTQKVLFGIAELGAGYIASRAKSLSRNERATAEDREKFSEMAEKFHEFESSIRERKLKIGEVDEVEESGYWNKCEFEDYDVQDEEPVSRVELQEKVVPSKDYYDEGKEKQQLSTALSNTDIGGQALDNLEKMWINYGNISNVSSAEMPEDEVGLVRLLWKGKVVFLVRAIELKKGGLKKKIKDLLDLSIGTKTRICKLIQENYEDITIEILSIGKDNNAVNIARNVERELIRKYKPEWN